jgi:lipopolysaccharide export system protein LptC
MNLKLIRIVVIIGIIILIGVMGFFGGWWDEIFKNINNNKTLTTQPVTSPIPGLVINQPKLVGWDGQKKTWEITATKMWQTDDNNFIYFEKIEKGIIYSTDTRVDFTAGWARWERLRELLYIGDGLEARTDVGYFGTAEAIMNYRTQELFCPKEVIYSETNKVMRANMMRLNFKTEEISLEGDVELSQDRDIVKAGAITYNSKDKQYRLLEPEGITIYP